VNEQYYVINRKKFALNEAK